MHCHKIILIKLILGLFVKVVILLIIDQNHREDIAINQLSVFNSIIQGTQRSGTCLFLLQVFSKYQQYIYSRKSKTIETIFFYKNIRRSTRETWDYE